MSTSTPSKQVDAHTGIDFVVRSALAGGFAGGLAKTTVAPLDRVKILFQTQNADFHRFSGSWRGLPDALKYIVQTQGFKGLYRGHTLTLARAIPHAAIMYTVYDKARELLMPTPEAPTSFRRLLAGAITGLSAMPFTYPFELVRVRMAIDTKQHSGRPSPWNAVRTIWMEGGPTLRILHFYRGFSVSVLAAVPYRGGIFLIWETLNAHSRRTLKPETLCSYQTQIHLVVGAIAGTVAEVVTYPLGVVRRTQQASGAVSPDRMIGFRETVSRVWTQAGWRGFFAGLGIGLIKQVPMHSVSLAAWQVAKKVLDVEDVVGQGLEAVLETGHIHRWLCKPVGADSLKALLVFSSSASHQADMWLISGLFDGPTPGNLDIPQKQKLLKPNRSYILGRQLKDLNVNDKRISSMHCEFIVGPHTIDDAGNPSARPTLEIVSRVQKAKGISYTRADGTSGILGPNDRTFLDPNSCVALMSKAAVTLTWKPIIAVGKDIPLSSCADMGIKLLPAPHKEATHHLLSHYSANMLTAASLVTNSCFVKPEWLREVLRIGTLPPTDEESLEANFATAMPQEGKFRPAFSPSLLPDQKNFALWQPNEARLKLFHAYRFVCLQEKTREVDGELKDVVRLGEGEADSFDVGLGVVKFRMAVTRSRNKEGKTTVLVGDADSMQLAVGKDTWLHFVKEAQTFGLQILPPSKVIQAILEASVDVLAPNAAHQEQESSPLPEMVANTMASEPSLAPEAPKPAEDDAPPEPAPAPRRKLIRRAVASRATSTEPSIPPTFPATATADTETLVRPRRVLTRRAVGANPIITGLPDDPSVASVVLEEPPQVGAPAGKPVSHGKPDSASKVPATPLRNPNLKRRVVGGTVIDSDAPRIGLGGYVGVGGAKAQTKQDNGEPPLKKFKALFESTNPGGSGVETFEIMNSVPIDSLSQMPIQSGSRSHSQTQTLTQTQTQTPSQLGMPPPAQGFPSRFARPTASALDVLREEEEEGTQSLAGATRGTKRAADGDRDGDLDMAPVNGGEQPAAKKRAVENVNAVEPSGSKPLSKTKTITSKNTPGAPVGKPDKDTAFLKAVASSKKGKKTEDEFDREFNRLQISRPVLDEREDDQAAEWKVLADFGDDEGLRGNFMTIVELDVFERDHGGQERCKNPVWDGKPNFKKFKKKVVSSRAKVDVFLSDTNDYGMGPAYWKGGESSQNANQTQASMFGSQMQSQLNIAAGTQADNRPLMDSDDDTPLPKSRKAPSRAGSVRPSRAASAAPTKKTATKASAKASGSKSKKSGAALFLDSDDEIKEEDEDDVVEMDDPETMTLHSSAEVRAPAPSRRTTSRAGAGAQATAKTTKASSSKSKKAAPIVVEDDSDDEAVFKGFRGRK